MPHKLNGDRRRKFARVKYRATNTPDYDAALIRRGDLKVWLTEEAVTAWRALVSSKRGGQRICSDLAIEKALALRLVLHLPRARRRERCGLSLTFNRRSEGLAILPQRIELWPGMGDEASQAAR